MLRDQNDSISVLRFDMKGKVNVEKTINDFDKKLYEEFEKLGLEDPDLTLHFS